ncbi:MAG: hypothetical protein Kow00109_30510 [Acidobacteriota bacterium]
MRGKQWILPGSLFCLIAAAGLAGWIPAAQSGREKIERGRYLVHRVAKCIECHTPRTAEGDLDETRLLQGAPIPLRSPFPNRPWAFQAPTIAGLPGWSEEDVIYLLQNGVRPGGRRPLPPMPRFGMTREDAEAVVAYLKSLR